MDFLCRPDAQSIENMYFAACGDGKVLLIKNLGVESLVQAEWLYRKAKPGNAPLENLPWFYFIRRVKRGLRISLDATEGTSGRLASHMSLSYNYPPQMAFPSAPPVYRNFPAPPQTALGAGCWRCLLTFGLFWSVWLVVQASWVKKGGRSEARFTAVLADAVTTLFIIIRQSSRHG